MKRWLPAILWLAMISGIIFLADRHLARPLFRWVERHPGSDKVGHFTLMGAMSFFANIGTQGVRVTFARREWFVASAVIAVLAIGEEFTQLLFPWRTFDLLDMAADLAGIYAFGRLFVLYLRSRQPQQDKA